MKRHYYLLMILGLILVGCDKTIKIDLSQEHTNIQDHNDYNEQLEMNSFDNLYCFQVKIDDEVLRLPLSYKDLIKKGWSPVYQLEKKMDGESFYHDVLFQKENVTFLADINNNKKYSIHMNDALITSLTFHNHQNEKIIQLPKGIILGQSFKADLENAYGSPNDELDYEEDYDIILTYEYDIGKDIYFTVNKETQVVDSVQLFYFHNENEFQKIVKFHE